jgi:TetR/AcrR family transcriptional regulator, tetracycline repressor protein
MARRASTPHGPAAQPGTTLNPGLPPDPGLRREHLTRPRVVSAALAIVDRDGLDGLTMRALGRELGVDPMAAYHWFPDKAAILQGVAEAILAEIELPVADGSASWLDIAVALARVYRATLLRHPKALPVASTQPVMTPRGFELIERTSAALVAGGLRPGAALEAINAIAAFVIGGAMADAGVTPGSEPVEHDAIVGAYANIDASLFPTLVAAMSEAMEFLSDDELQFETAIDALVRGLEASFRERGLLA